MATLIPSLAACLPRMTPGGKRFAQRLEDKLEDDALCWVDLPIAPAGVRPGFLLLHPRNGMTLLEVKDWKPDALREHLPGPASLFPEAAAGQPPGPLESVRQCAQAVADVLEQDPQLTFSRGKLKGRLLFPWTYGLALTQISRRQFEAAGLARVLEPRRVICQDEMAEEVDAEAFRQRLRQMFHVGGYGRLSPSRIDRIRWRLFPEIRLPARRIGLPDEVEAPPEDDPAAVLDLAQEQLARSPQEGHRVIHGVAGSGKTLILGCRAELLARTAAKPVLVLCRSPGLGRRLERWMQARGVADKVHIATFHAWCHHQLTAHHVGLPPGDPGDPGYRDDLARRVAEGVDRRLIPAGQYEAVLIDEGHDFRPEWLKLAVRMLDPLTDSLLLLRDEAQALRGGGRPRDFSLASVGIRARGRTSRLAVNYRNTREILEFAAGFARPLPGPDAGGADDAPLLVPVSAGRHGEPPRIVRLPSLREEAAWLADRLRDAHRAGMAWRDMAVLYRHEDPAGKTVNSVLRLAGIPHAGKEAGRFGSRQDRVSLLSFENCPGLEFPLVAIPGMAREAPDEETEARLLYVALTRATRTLLLTGS